jgi:cytidine deaminase
MEDQMLSDLIRKELIQKAITVRSNAYAPYSNYPVGAALLTESDRIFTGVNVENAGYSETICAERVAVVKAVSDGEKAFQAIAVVTENGGSPCGSCRQVLSEFGGDTVVIIADKDGILIKETSVADLLPGAFTPEFLDAAHDKRDSEMNK